MRPAFAAVAICIALGVSAAGATAVLAPAQVAAKFRTGESGSTMSGDRYWLAKKRYGNLVLWWYGTAKKIDPTFQRLHRALVGMTSGP